MKSENRRGFIRKSVIVSTGLAAGAPAYIKGYVQNKPNDVINIAVAGIGSRGGYYGGSGHTGNFTKIKNSRVVAICDPDENLFPKAIADIEKLGGAKPRTVVDFRELLDDKDIDAVAIASPDYWHALQTIWACQAGKDVYVEKPISYTLGEGRKMVEAARKYNRIVQAGTQYRSNKVIRKGIQMLHDGVIGDIYMGRGIVYGHRGNIGRVPDSPAPSGLNWELFRGPAPMIPYNKNHSHYNWHWYWDTSTAEFGNNGVHVMDQVRWGMNKTVHPKKIHCCGGYYAWDSDQEIPNLQIATFEYPDGTIMETEVRSLYTNQEQGGKSGSFFYGTKGWMHITGERFITFMGTKDEPGPTMSVKDFELDEYRKAGIEFHFVNFLDSIRSRKWQELNAEIEQGHMSTSIMHLGNVSYRTGRKLIFDGEKEKFLNDPDADSYLLRKEYRKPYILPKEV